MQTIALDQELPLRAYRNHVARAEADASLARAAGYPVTADDVRFAAEVELRETLHRQNAQRVRQVLALVNL